MKLALLYAMKTSIKLQLVHKVREHLQIIDWDNVILNKYLVLGIMKFVHGVHIFPKIFVPYQCYKVWYSWFARVWSNNPDQCTP